MTRSLILHIGTPKTGSTTIQYLLSHNRPALRAQGIYYPATPHATNHMLLAVMFTTGTATYEQFDDPIWNGKDPDAQLAAYRESFRQEIIGLPPEINRVIVSSEQFPQLVRDVKDIARLHELMAGLFDDIKIIVYLRRQDEHIASTYSQGLRRGIIRRPSFNRWNQESHFYDYARMLDNWASVFGENAIVPRIFERGPDKSFDVVDDFLTQAGVSALPAAEGAAPRNQSMNMSGQRILREIGFMLTGDEARKIAQTPLWKRLTRTVTASLPGTGWRPTQDEAKKFMEQFEGSNEAVRKRYFPDRKSLFSTDFSQLPVEEAAPDRKADKQAAYTVILYLLKQSVAHEQQNVKRQVSAAQQPDHRRSALIKALRHDPGDVETRLQLAELQIEGGAYGAARHNVRKVLKAAPGNIAALAMLERLDATGDAEIEDSE